MTAAPHRRGTCLKSAVAIGALLLLAACSGPAGAAKEEPPPEASAPEAQAPEEEAPTRPATAEPEAPEENAGPVRRTVQGFRIQILTTEQKATADARVEEALRWWEGVPRPRRPAHMKTGEPPLSIAWRQPYYRVRLGAFASQAEARRALALVAERFPEAFIIPDTVTIVR